MVPTVGSYTEQQSQALLPDHPKSTPEPPPQSSSSERVSSQQFEQHPYYHESGSRQSDETNSSARMYHNEEVPSINPNDDNLYSSKAEQSTNDLNKPSYAAEDSTAHSYYHNAYTLNDGKLSNSGSKAIPGLDLVPGENSHHVTEQEPPGIKLVETRGMLEGDLQSAHLWNEPSSTPQGESGKRSDSRGQKSDQMIQSLGKIVSQLQALQEKNVNSIKSQSGAVGKNSSSSWKKDNDEEDEVTYPVTAEKTEDDTTKKVAALIENESDSEGEETSSKPVLYQPTDMDESREFSGFDTARTMYQEETYHGEVDEEHFTYGNYPEHKPFNRGGGQPGYNKNPQFYGHEDMALKEPHYHHSHHYKGYPGPDGASQPPINQLQYHSKKYEVDPPIDNLARVTAYHNQDYRPSPPRLPPPPPQPPYIHTQHRHMGYEYEGPSRSPLDLPPADEKQPVYYDRQEYQYGQKPMYADYEDSMPAADMYRPPPKNFPSVDYQHSSTSRLISSMQSVDYDHGRGLDSFDTG